MKEQIKFQLKKRKTRLVIYQLNIYQSVVEVSCFKLGNENTIEEAGLGNDNKHMQSVAL